MTVSAFIGQGPAFIPKNGLASGTHSGAHPLHLSRTSLPVRSFGAATMPNQMSTQLGSRDASYTRQPHTLRSPLNSFVSRQRLSSIKLSALAANSPAEESGANSAKSDKAGPSVPDNIMRPPPGLNWDSNKADLKSNFGLTDDQIEKYETVSPEDRREAHKNAVLYRKFEVACNKAYMQKKIAGFMHLDNGQESIPTLIADSIKKDDKKCSFYREHCHAIASGVSPNKVMAELMMKKGGTCQGAGGSMHIYDKEHNFGGGWALVAEQIPYGAGMARSILLDQELGLTDPEADDRIAVVMMGEGAAQNGRMAETLNTAAKENLPLLFLVIDNGRAINTFTDDVATETDVYKLGKHFGIPGIKVDGQNIHDTLRVGRAVTDYVRDKGPAILQIHTYRFQGHSPADPQHERGRKDEMRWARAEMDPIKIDETAMLESGIASAEDLKAISKEVDAIINEAVEFADASEMPHPDLAAELEFTDDPNTDYNQREVASHLKGITERTVPQEKLDAIKTHMDGLHALAKEGKISIADAANLAILEEFLRDPTVTMHAEDLQAGSSYNIPKGTQQTFGKLRASDRIISEGHFVGLGIGEGMNGYRPVVEAMNTNFMIYAVPEISSAANTYATSGGEYNVPLTILGAGGTAPNQALGAEHSQPFHAYIMGVPGLKIGTAADPAQAYSMTKAAIRDNGPVFLFFPVKMMKDTLGTIEPDKCAQLNKARLLNKADASMVKARKTATVMTYLHGVREAKRAVSKLQEKGYDVDLIELNSLKPLDLDTIGKSLDRTNKAVLLDESTDSGGVGATISAKINEVFYDKLDGPVNRICMKNAPVPYASSMEESVVPREADLIKGVIESIDNKR